MTIIGSICSSDGTDEVLWLVAAFFVAFLAGVLGLAGRRRLIVAILLVVSLFCFGVFLSASPEGIHIVDIRWAFYEVMRRMRLIEGGFG